MKKHCAIIVLVLSISVNLFSGSNFLEKMHGMILQTQKRTAQYFLDDQQSLEKEIDDRESRIVTHMKRDGERVGSCEDGALCDLHKELELLIKLRDEEIAREQFRFKMVQFALTRLRGKK